MTPPASTPSLLPALVQREIALGNGKALAEGSKPGPVGRTMDAVAGVVSPRWQQARVQRRMETCILAGGYDVTKPSRTRRQPPTIGGDQDKHQDDRTLWTIREICRDHDRNSSLLHGIIDRAADNVAGPEYGFRPDSGDSSYDEQAGALLAEEARAIEYRGLFNLQDIVYTGFRSLYPDGDFLIHHLSGGQVQMIEAHDLVTPTSGKGMNERKVVGGVEIDADGRHVAYYIADPREKNKAGYGWVEGWQKAQRLEAADVQHVCRRTRFTQTRGVPELAASLDLYERLDGYLDSETLAAELASHLAWFVKRAGTGNLPGTDTYSDPNQTANSSTASLYDRVLRSEPGQVFDLLTDEEIGVVKNERPGDTFEPYIVTMLRMVGAGLGMPLELVLLDFSKTNYSSARASLLQAYRVFQRWQRFVRDWIIQPAYDRMVRRWIASRKLSPVRNASRLRYYPPRWAWIDPLKEVLAMEKRISCGAGTLEDWVVEEGKIFDQLMDVRERELKELKRRMIPTTTAPNNLGGKERKASNGA
jgi:lambda family phage portal protein